MESFLRMIDVPGGIFRVDMIVFAIFIPLLFIYIALGIDEALYDLVAWLLGLRGGRVERLSESMLRRRRQKRIAIAVAGWKEHEVIGRMIRGNRSRIDYANYEFFIGVYPNDLETVEVAHKTAAEIPGVTVVVNSLPGPTSKGQMLNQVCAEVLNAGSRSGVKFDAILVHDCEDLIHPMSLLAINEKLEDADFVQVPVFSLPVGMGELVAGTYMDEFAESHTKDLRLRNRLAESIPGAGVGMALSRNLIEKYFASEQKAPFHEASLTEDYELGVKVRDFGGRCHFLFSELDTRPGEIIATREYFPKRFTRSVRQKTRWTMGIVFQGTRHLGWKGSLTDKYFFYRDRKGPAANVSVLVGFVASMYCAARLALSPWMGPLHAPHSLMHGLGPALLPCTSFLMANRVWQRGFACYSVYGWKAALLSPLRVVVGNVINALASVRAFWQWADHRVRGAAVRWVKTEHELPDDFGLETGAPSI